MAKLQKHTTTTNKNEDEQEKNNSCLSFQLASSTYTQTFEATQISSQDITYDDEDLILKYAKYKALLTQKLHLFSF